MINIEHIKDLKKRIQYLKNSLDIENKQRMIHEKELLTQKKGFWEDSKNAEKLMRELKQIKNTTNAFYECFESIEESEIMFSFFLNKEILEDEMQKEYSKSLSLLEGLEFKKMLSDTAFWDREDAIAKLCEPLFDFTDWVPRCSCHSGHRAASS